MEEHSSAAMGPHCHPGQHSPQHWPTNTFLCGLRLSDECLFSSGRSKCGEIKDMGEIKGVVACAKGR